jgi:S1-C subfamily serine protease
MTDAPITNSLADLSGAIADIVAKTAPSIVAVHSRGRFPTSGIVWRPGLIITAEEALETDEGLIVVTADGRKLEAKLLGRDPSTDIALLRIDDETLAPLPLVGDARLALGHLVMAIGRTHEGTSANLGIVATEAGAWRSQRGGDIDRLVRFDLRTNRLIEGGAIVDAQGRAAGMLVLGPRRSALLIPTPTIERVAEQLLANGRIARGYMGFALQPVRIEDAQATQLGLDKPRGIMVMSVDPDGPGRTAGMHIGDVIAKWNSESVHGVRGLARHLGPESVGQPVTITYLRGGEVRTATLTPTQRRSA